MTASRLAANPLPAHFRLHVQKEQLRFASARRTTRGIHHSRTLYTIICETEDGYLGRGEACPIAGLSPEYRDELSYETSLHEACREVEALQHLPEQAYREQSSLRFALESAILRAQTAAHHPIWDSPFTRGECAIPIHHLIWMNSIADMEEELQAGVDAGFRCVKMKVGSHDWQEELAFIQRARDAYPDLEIRVDANGSFPSAEAGRRLAPLADLAVSWIEQPIAPERSHELSRLIAHCPAPLRIALDEQLIGCPSSSIKPLLDSIQPHGLVLKPSLHGGLSGCEEWLHAARARGIECWTNSMLESQLGLTVLAEWSAHHMPNTLHALSKGNLYCHDSISAAFPTCKLEGVYLQYVI